ncbi:MAG: hypothetical protein KKF62_09295 [Bacteroidetes bacterium]|nr:hypothetical protein [Bacteroidota bacterium]MBU1116733.1 hypothetical protein [Bacteroidota bacterium]MBU1798132.1 hypothetical protein [Bacteroidota bacterium]
MADSVYISSSLTKDQLLFLQLLNEKEVEYFTIYGIEEQLSHSFSNINEVLENLVHKNFIYRLQKGYYAVKSFNNQNVIGTFISQNSAVAYWSALNIHGLTSRFPNKVFIQTTKRKKDKTILGVHYQFVTIPERKRVGITSLGYGNNSYAITDIEKTIIDCFDLSIYSGGFDLLLSAFSLAKLNSNKMIEYAEAVNNLSVTKRLGFLSELLNKKGLQTFIKYAKLKVNKKYTLIDSAGKDSGEFILNWRLRLNVSMNEIVNLSKELY